MRIAVNTRFLLKDKLEGIGWFTFEIMKRITQKHPEHEFIFLFDRPFEKQFVFGANVKGKIVPPPARHPILWRLWFEQSLPFVLRKVKADLFISPDGFCSLKTKVPTMLVVHDLAFEHFPEHIPSSARKFYQKYTPQYVKRADHIITVSEYSKKDMAQKYQVPVDKIDVVYNAVNSSFQPISTKQKEQVKKEYAGWQEYFLFVSALQPRKNVVRLLKAFDRFKKNNTCDIKLLVVGSHTWIKEEIDNALEEASHKEDIIFTGHLRQKELAEVMGAAIALCYVSLFEGFGIPVLEAMQAGVPVITSNTSSMPEVAGDAAIIIDPYSEYDIAAAMTKIYREPQIRSELIEKGIERQKKFSWDLSAEKFWQIVERQLLK